MKSIDEITRIAKRTLAHEAKAVDALQEGINAEFATIVQLILNSEGRVVVSGIGKSANIAAKMVATLNSTGTPAMFMHAADAIHGDLGMVQKNDVVICLSKSGNTPEIKVLVPLVKNAGNSLIALVGNVNSTLAQQADYILNATVDQEACPNNLAPTASTTAQLAIGDALAVCLMECRGFSSEDFARYHPGGALGKRLYTTVGDLIDSKNVPIVSPTASIREVIVEISTKRLGATAVLDNHRLAGVITDGDLRRMLERESNIDALTAADVMNETPKSIDAAQLAVKAFAEMEKHSITQLLVLDNEAYVGVVHLHDILREGIYL